MRLKFYILALAVSFAAVGCVDSDYDLSSVSADDFSVGDSGTKIAAPIATVTITSDKFVNSPSMVGITRMSGDLVFDEAISLIDAFLPSGKRVNLDKLTNEATKDEEVSSLVDALISELKSKATKRAELAKSLYTYLNDETLDMTAILESISEDIDTNATQADILEDIETLLATGSDDDIQSLKDAISGYITGEVIDYINKYRDIEIAESVDPIEIPSEVTDILTGTLAGEDSKIEVVATYEHNLPFVFSFGDDGNGDECVTLYNGDATPSTMTINITKAGKPKNPSEIDLDELTAILGNGSGAKIMTNINLSSYLANSADSYWIKLKISIVKTGALVF